MLYTSSHPTPSLLQVSIGMLGIITQVTFSVEEQYLLREVLTQHSLDDCLTNFNSLMTSGEHVKMWTELYSGKCGVFVASRTSETRPRDGPSWTLKNIEVSYMYIPYITIIMLLHIDHGDGGCTPCHFMVPILHTPCHKAALSIIVFCLLTIRSCRR